MLGLQGVSWERGWSCRFLPEAVTKRLPQGVGAGGDASTPCFLFASPLFVFSNLIRVLFIIIFMSVVYLSRGLMGIILFSGISLCITSSHFLFLPSNHLSGNLAVFFSL